MTDIGLTHIAVPVRSLEASVSFYETYASMQVVHRRPGVAWVSDRTRPFAIVLLETSGEIHPLLPMAHLALAFHPGPRSTACANLQCRAIASHARRNRWSRLSDTGRSFEIPTDTLEVAYGQDLGGIVEGGALVHFGQA